MKKIIKIFSCICFITIAIVETRGQCVVNTTTTDWNQFNSGAGPSNNDFNWTTPGLVYPVYLQDNLDNPSRNIELPYFCSQSGGTGSCGNKNTLAYELLGNTATDQDINPEDGWELVLKNFGTPNATPGDNTGRGVANPFFILYNRYTGRMKTYLAVTGVRSGSSALLRIEFDQSNKRTALFSHAEPIAKTFDKFNSGNRFSSINEIAEQNFQDDYYWLVSEIQTAYDPCACTRKSGYTSPSVIVITPIIITSSAIEAKIEGTLEQQLVDGNGNTVAQEKKKTSFKEVHGAAVSGYTEWNSYKNQANTFFDFYNQSYKDKVLKDWWRENIKYDPNLQGIPKSQQETMFNTFKSSSDGFKNLVGVDDINKYNKTTTILKGVASALPYVGAAVGIIDLISQGGNQNASATSAPPIVFNANFSLSGTINTENDLPNFAFQNPGTIDPGNPSSSHLTPIYNNVLGVFNVLKEPVFEYYKIEPDVWLVNPNHPAGISPQFPEGDWVDAHAAPLKQYHLSQDVKYVINSVSNLEVELIDACYVFEYNGDDGLYLEDPNAYSTTKALPFYTDIYKNDTEISIGERLNAMEKAGYHLESLSADYPTGANSRIRFRTNYVPLKCLPNVNFMFLGNILPKVYIKLLVRMKRTDDPNAAGVTQIITYDASQTIQSASELTSNIEYKAFLEWGQSFNGGVYWEYSDVSYESFELITPLPLDNPYYGDHDVIYVSSMGNIEATGEVTIPDNTTVPANTVIRAIGEIIIGQNVTFGDNVELVSGTFIDVPPGPPVNQTLKIKIDPYLDLFYFNCTSSDVISLKATQTEIDAICNSTSYLQNSGQQKKSSFDYIPKEEVYVTECIFYPNPTTSTLYLSLELEQNADFDIIITDVTGKTIYNESKKGRKGKNIEGIDVNRFSAGVYFISVNSGSFKKNDKFIVTR